MAERVEIRVEAIDAASATFGEVSKKIKDTTSTIRDLEARAKAAGLALNNIKVNPVSGKVSFKATEDMSEQIAAMKAAKNVAKDLARKQAEEERAIARAKRKEELAEAKRLQDRGDLLRTTFGNLAANMLVASLGAAADIAGKLVGALDNAGKFQTQSIAASQDIASNLNTPLNVAKDIVEKSQIEIAKMAASLPGETQDYSTVFNSLSGTLADNFRGNAAGFQKAALDMTKRVTALAAIRGANVDDAGSSANRFLAGTTTFGEIRKNDLFQKNPQLQKMLMAVAAEEGVTLEKWQQLTQAQRYKIFNRALQLAAPDTLFDAFQGTYEAVTQQIKTSLIDPQMGIFGVLRKVNLGVDFDSTVLDEAARSLSALFDLFSSIGQLAKNMGFDFDPMQSLAKSLNSFTGFLRGLDAAIQSFLGGGSFDLGNAFGFEFNPAKMANDVIDKMLKAVANFDAAKFGQVLGNGLAGRINGVTKFLMSLDYMKIGMLFGVLVGKVIWAISSAIFSAVTSINWVDQILSIFTAPFRIIGAIFGAGIGFVGTMIQKFFDDVKNFFTMIGDALKSAIDSIPSFGNTAISAGVSAVNPIAGGVLGALNPMGVINNIIGGGEGKAKDGVAKDPLKEVKGSDGKPLVSAGLPQPNLPQSGGGGSFSPTIQVSAGNITDPDTLANLTLQKLAAAHEEYQRKRL